MRVTASGSLAVNASAETSPCRVAVEVGKVCAIKTGMGLEDGAMEQDEGFGLWIWGVAEVEDVAVGP